jgi:hypothetical protein
MRQVAILVLAVLGCLALLSGCGGGDGGNVVPVNVGTVSGSILAGREDQIGFGGVQILLNTQTVPAVTVARGTSGGDGTFLIENVPPGLYDVVLVVDPATGYRVDPYADPITVRVIVGPNTPLGNIPVPEESELPPDPPAEP